MNASIPADAAGGRRDLLAQIALAPFQARSYTNLVFLLLAMPLGILHFTFLVTGLSMGFGMIITLLGLPILGLTVWGSWWLTAMERKLAMGLLGAEVPPMGPVPFRSGKGFRYDLEELLGNRVTWTGMLYLGLKLPLGILSFTMAVTMIAVSMSFLLVPFLYPLSFIEWDGVLLWWVDSPAEAGLCFLAGLLFTYVSLLLLNGLAALWKMLATAALGSPRFAVAAAAPVAMEAEAPAAVEPEAPAEAPQA